MKTPIETSDSIGVFAALIVRQSPERCLFHQHIRIAEGTRVVYLQGLWQDHSIVREVETELRRELSLVEPLRGGKLEVAKRIAAARNPVSLHLRRGDYGPFFWRAYDAAHRVLPTRDQPQIESGSPEYVFRLL